MQKRKCKVARDGGDIIIELRAQKAQPIEGVLSNLKGEVITPERREDDSVVVWRVSPAENSGCVFYGVVTPMGRIWGSPRYERRIMQDGALVKGLTNPAVIKTRKVNAAEWVGPPEAIRFA